MSDINMALRLILENQIVTMLAISKMDDQPVTAQRLLGDACTDTAAALKHPFFCDHDWEDGYSMNGPTKTCRKCRKFMRD